MTYDFSTLSPPEFEDLCHDLLERHYSAELQSFTTGRDGGIDLRRAISKDKKWIVQCKHFLKSGYSSLLSHLKNKELPKVRKNKPEKYILTTSVGLTPDNVDELFSLLHPHCKSPDDIFGQSSLNDLLRKYPEVEQANFKLWIASEPVLTRLLHNSAFVERAMSIEEIKRRVSLYVKTKSVDEARARLEKDHVCIIAGIPGIGKTTLAEMLLMEYVADGWEVITATGRIENALNLYRHESDTRQIIYYDDFLGQVSSVEKLEKNEDKSLLRLISSIERRPTKRFLLTTREYVLEQAKSDYEALWRSDIDIFKYVLAFEDYTEMDKARILLNHLFFWNVPQGHISSIVKDQMYKDIINHLHYSPRLIETMTNPKKVMNCPSDQYAELFLDQLDDPSTLWDRAYHKQLNECAKSLLISLATCGRDVWVSDLKSCYQSLVSTRSKRYLFTVTSNSFNESLKELEGNFIRLQAAGDDIVVYFHNPSILDFMRKLIYNDLDNQIDVMCSAVYFDQVNWLAKLIRECDGDRTPQVPANVVAAAIERTISSADLQLFSYRLSGSNKLEWTKDRLSRFVRLKQCIHFVPHWSGNELSQIVMRLVDSELDNLNPTISSIREVAGLIEAMIKSDCCVVAHERWISCCNEFVEEHLEAEDWLNYTDEALKELACVARWYSTHQESMGDNKQSVRSRVINLVRDEVDRADVYEWVEEVCEELHLFETRLEEDFSKERDILNEWLYQHAEGDDGFPFGDSKDNSRLSEGSSQSIDSMFRSLLE